VPRKLCLVTGVDEAMFFQLLLLGESLRRHSPSFALHVCDFGLTEPQRAYVHRRFVLLDKPDIAARHPWDYKARLGRYVAGTSCDAVVWIDADMIVLGDLEAPLQTLLAEMLADDHALAAPDIGMSIGEQLAADPAPSYAALVQGFDPATPYLSSGFFMCRADGFFEVWAQQTALMNFEMLYEQNAFNLTALGSRAQVRILDRFRWNLGANDLQAQKIELSDGALAVTGPSSPALILHATSDDRPNDLLMMTTTVPFDGRTFEATMRMIARPPPVLDFQREMAGRAMEAEAGPLVDCGVWP
jgi:hypothetical protein